MADVVSVYRLTMDIKKPTNHIETPVIVQYDNVRLEVTVLDGGQPFDLSSVSNIEFVHQRPDGQIIVQPGSLEDGKIIYTYAGNEMDVPGNIRTSFSMINNDEKVSVRDFYVVVAKSLKEAMYMPGAPGFDRLQALIVQVEALSTMTTEAATLATTQADYAKSQGDYIEERKPDIDRFLAEQTNLETQITQTNERLNDNSKFDYQSSLVETVKSLLHYKDMYFRKISDTSLEVILTTANGRHITHVFTAKQDGYLISFNCFTGPVVDTPRTVGYKWSDFNSTTTGNFVVQENAVVYTTSVGSAFTINFETIKDGRFIAQLFNDDRGGLWKFTLDGGRTTTISTHTAAVTTPSREIFNNIPEGSHSVRAEFLGADPNNAPRGGTARGWLADTRNNAFTVNDNAIGNSNAAELFAVASNREFAFRFAPEGVTETEWIPYHETVTAAPITPASVVLDGVSTPLTSLQTGKMIKAQDFKLIQELRGFSPSNTSASLLNVRTIQSINRQEGTFRVSGSMRTLQNITIGDSYVIMGAVNNAVFDNLLTGIGNNIPAILTDNTITQLTEEGDKNLEYAYTSSQNNYVVAYKNNDLRRNQILNFPELKRVNNFLQHRNQNVLKQYSNIFARGPLSQGFRYSWGGEYAVGEIEGIRSLL